MAHGNPKAWQSWLLLASPMLISFSIIAFSEYNYGTCGGFSHVEANRKYVPPTPAWQFRIVDALTLIQVLWMIFLLFRTKERRVRTLLVLGLEGLFLLVARAGAEMNLTGISY